MRVKTGTVRRQAHKKILASAKGFWMTRHKRFKIAKQAVMHAGQYAYNGRRIRRRDLRRLWIVRINAALTPFNLRYSTFINLLKTNKIELDRKSLANLAATDPGAFKAVVAQVQK